MFFNTSYSVVYCCLLLRFKKISITQVSMQKITLETISSKPTLKYDKFSILKNHWANSKMYL